MINFTQKLFEEFNVETSLQQADEKDVISTLALKLDITARFMDRLRVFIKDYSFMSPSEEILFFKKIKHQFYTPLIFYSELLYVHTNAPVADKKTMINYFRQQIENNNNFIERNRILLTYHKTGHCESDELMFLRHSDCYPLLLEYPGDIDTSFCTISSSVLSKLLAFENVNTYLSEQIERLKLVELPCPNIVEVVPDNRQVKFLGKKADLHELVFAMHEHGDFGEVPLNWVMETFSKILDVVPGNYYSSLTDLAMRKKSRTPYLNSLIDSLEKRLDRKLDSL